MKRKNDLTTQSQIVSAENLAIAPSPQFTIHPETKKTSQLCIAGFVNQITKTLLCYSFFYCFLWKAHSHFLPYFITNIFSCFTGKLIKKGLHLTGIGGFPNTGTCFQIPGRKNRMEFQGSGNRSCYLLS